VGRRLSTLAGFYRYCEQEQIRARSPAAHVRRPKQDYESRTLGLDRNELGAVLVAAGLSSNRDHALASLLASNGLRIFEAVGADIDESSVEGGHCTLRVVRKGGTPVTIPLRPRHRQGDRSGHRRAGARADPGRRVWSTPRPLRRHPDRQTPGDSGGDRQVALAAQPAPQLHPRRLGRRRLAARRARRRLPRRPPHHHARRPGPPQPRPPRHLIVSTFVAGAAR
jgi:integrase/recombinase XerD